MLHNLYTVSKFLAILSALSFGAMACGGEQSPAGIDVEEVGALALPQCTAEDGCPGGGGVTYGTVDVSIENTDSVPHTVSASYYVLNADGSTTAHYFQTPAPIGAGETKNYWSLIRKPLGTTGQIGVSVYDTGTSAWARQEPWYVVQSYRQRFHFRFARVDGASFMTVEVQ